MKLNRKNIAIHRFTVLTFVSLYFIVSSISMFHVISFFNLSNPDWLAVSLAIAFEIGAAASLAAIAVKDKLNMTLVWMLFIVLTFMQMMGNMYYAYVNLHDYQGWAELFGLSERDPIFQKRILSIVSGALLPLVALGFIKSLVDYLKPVDEEIEKKPTFDDLDSETESEIEVEKKIEIENTPDDDISSEIVSTIIEPEIKPEDTSVIEPTNAVDDYEQHFNESKQENFILKEKLQSNLNEMERNKIKYEKNVTEFEKQLDALKKELEEEKKKTQFEKDLDSIEKKKEKEGKGKDKTVGEVSIKPHRKVVYNNTTDKPL